MLCPYTSTSHFWFAPRILGGSTTATVCFWYWLYYNGITRRMNWMLCYVRNDADKRWHGWMAYMEINYRCVWLYSISTWILLLLNCLCDTNNASAGYNRFSTDTLEICGAFTRMGAVNGWYVVGWWCGLYRQKIRYSFYFWSMARTCMS